MKNNGVFLHKTDHWKTPLHIYEYFMKLGCIDPCPYHSKNDNLKVDMGGGRFIYKSTL